MIDIKDLNVSVKNGKKKRMVLKDFSLHIANGEVDVLFGPNGSGKTSLVHTILGFPGYTVESGKIIFNDVDITNLPINERAQMGIGCVMQYPPAIRGITLNDMANLVLGKKKSRDISQKTSDFASKLNVTDFLTRDVNYGFSGGEKKRAEVLQAILQDPMFLVLDEPDSGVDVENVEIIGRILNRFLQRDESPHKRKKSGLIITHLGYLLNFIKTDRAHVMCEGQNLCSGASKEIYEHILEKGFDECVNACLIDVREEAGVK